MSSSGRSPSGDVLASASFEAQLFMFSEVWTFYEQSPNSQILIVLIMMFLALMSAKPGEAVALWSDDCLRRIFEFKAALLQIS